MAQKVLFPCSTRAMPASLRLPRFKRCHTDIQGKHYFAPFGSLLCLPPCRLLSRRFSFMDSAQKWWLIFAVVHQSHPFRNSLW